MSRFGRSHKKSTYSTTCSGVGTGRLPSVASFRQKLFLRTSGFAGFQASPGRVGYVGAYRRISTENPPGSGGLVHPRPLSKLTRADDYTRPRASRVFKLRYRV